MPKRVAFSTEFCKNRKQSSETDLKSWEVGESKHLGFFWVDCMHLAASIQSQNRVSQRFLVLKGTPQNPNQSFYIISLQSSGRAKSIVIECLDL